MNVLSIKVDLDRFPVLAKYQNLSRQEVECLPIQDQMDLSVDIISFQSEIDWNTINEINFAKTTKKESAVEMPVIPTQPKPFRSWLEFHMFHFTAARQAVYEPKESKVEYTVKCTYQPDMVSPMNPDVCFEFKGVIHSADDARKYRLVKEQTNLTIIFVFMSRDIELPFQKRRTDGSKQTHEQWCKANGFEYTYHDVFDEYIRSDRYRELVVRKKLITDI